MKTISLQQHNRNLRDGKYEVANLLHKRGEFDQAVFIQQRTKTGKRFYRDLIVIDYWK
jgi:hypothetical protein